jgi:hypothetical protein
MDRHQPSEQQLRRVQKSGYPVLGEENAIISKDFVIVNLALKQVME